MSRPIVLTSTGEPNEIQVRDRLAEIAKGRAPADGPIRIRKVRAGPSRSLSFGRNALDSTRSARETTARAQSAIADLAAAPWADEDGRTRIEALQLAAFDDLSLVLHVLHPHLLDSAIAHPGSPWRPAWCIDSIDGTDILPPAVVEAVFSRAPHLATFTRNVGGSMNVSFHDALRFEAEDVDMVRAMRLVSRLRDEGVL